MNRREFLRSLAAVGTALAIDPLALVGATEADHTGSTYYAAELRMDIAAANQLAESQGIPIRFAHDEDWV
jgi:hypothetical protein